MEVLDLTLIQKLFINISIMIMKLLLSVILTIIFAKIVGYLITKVMRRTLVTKKASEQRIITILGMTNNLIRYLTIVIIILVILIIGFGIPWESLLAGAGILGIIVGFGAKELISDMVSGFFVIFEGTFEVGEYIKVNNFEGYVIDLGIKSTVIKTYENEKVTIPNSLVQEVVNFSKDNYVLYYYFTTSYDVKVEVIEKLVNNEILPKIIELEKCVNASFLGLDEFQASAISYGIAVTTYPEYRFMIKREINKIISVIFEEYDIEIPYQNITINYKKEEKC